MELLNIILGFASVIPFITIIGSGSAPKKKKKPTGITIIPTRIPADASRKERDAIARKDLRKKLPVGGVFGTPINLSSKDKIRGDILRKQRKEGKITVAQFREAFEPAPQPPTQMEIEQAKAEAAGLLEEEGAFEDVTPVETPLGPTADVPDIPFLGVAAAGFWQGLFQNENTKDWFKNTFPEGKGIETGEGAFPLPSEATLREAALNEIRIASFNEGISNAETFGTIIEGIPVVGGLVSKHVGGLTETPSANAQNVIQELESLGTESTNNQEKTRSGIMDAGIALDRAREMEESIAELEGRLKLLIITSPILLANTDEVNKIQQKIFETKERTRNFRMAATFARTAQLTATGRIVPTDEQMFFELKRLNEGTNE